MCEVTKEAAVEAADGDVDGSVTFSMLTRCVGLGIYRLRRGHSGEDGGAGEQAAERSQGYRRCSLFFVYGNEF